MVCSMAIDLLRRAGVAWLVTLGACGPVVRPDQPASEPGPVSAKVETGPTKVRGRQVVVGELCPQGAGGRPAVAPVVMRSVRWTDSKDEVSAAVERGSTPRFVVYGVDGKIAGRFDTLGLAEIRPGQAVASGTYVGAAPCTVDDGTGKRVDDAKCIAATAGCGLAVAELGRPDEPPDMANIAVGGACLQDNALAVDIDGDKVMEQFPLPSILDGIRSPAKEWSAAPVVGAKCAPKFEVLDLKIVPHLEPGRGSAADHIVGLDLIGVVDLDADGRMELVIAFEFPTVRTIAVYAATGSPQRLELVGEGEAFPR
jgi:hypothetical protein